ncbi:MAG: helix-turn-helix domain-containing protein [Acetobacter papayae]|uniref:helix-turn-helix domain-containing protein n=1 Tax=Acetobacter papayae TaxID=1076592 RepID=UPI0039EA933C
MAGRPSKYQDEFAEQARKLCLLGATDQDLADFFEVSEQTVNAWKTSYPEFLESIKKGKDLADAEVAARLFHRAVGYSHKAVKIFNDQGKPLVVDYEEHYPPDTAAAIFWLKNRQRAKWRDKQDVEHTGPDGGPVQVSEVRRVIVRPPDKKE